jgi:succinoglycan biosynthesis protein ExoM
MTRISICICTRKRQEGLIKLLRSINDLQITPDMDVRVIIVENDVINHSEKIIYEHSAESRFPVSYFLEKKKGLVYARNRSVREAGDTDFCCFTDDDQTVASEWLTEFLKCQQEFDCDGVAGPTYPVFNKEVPDYIMNYHKPKIYDYGTVIETAYTGCLLIRKKYLDLFAGPFDERLNFTGGEDIYLTYLISNIGGEIRYNPNAITFENFPESRATIRYAIQRTYRNSNTGLFVKSLRNTKNFKMRIMPRLVLRFSYGILIVLPYLFFGGEYKLKGLKKIVDALGGFYFMLGSINKYYK